MKVSEDYAPATYNNPELTRRVVDALQKTLGAANVVEVPPIMASEDFGNLGLSGQIPRLSSGWAPWMPLTSPKVNRPVYP